MVASWACEVTEILTQRTMKKPLLCEDSSDPTSSTSNHVPDIDISGVRFGEAFGPTEKMMTGNIFLVMSQNDFGHDQDRDFIRVFKYCYFSVNKYLQRVHLLNL